MNLLADVATTLSRRGIAFAAIGAAAMAVHGVSRSTNDIDLLVIDQNCLQSDLWNVLREQGAEVDIRRGDIDDPLFGVIRITLEGQRDVDVIVGRESWQRDVLNRAKPGLVAGIVIPTVSAFDIALLKLHAGGPQDVWDIQQLIAGDGHEQIIKGVQEHISTLAPRERKLWQRILKEVRENT